MRGSGSEYEDVLGDVMDRIAQSGAPPPPPDPHADRSRIERLLLPVSIVFVLTIGGTLMLSRRPPPERTEVERERTLAGSVLIARQQIEEFRRENGRLPENLDQWMSFGGATSPIYGLIWVNASQAPALGAALNRLEGPNIIQFAGSTLFLVWN